MKKLIAALLGISLYLLAPISAPAQSVQQSGTVSRNHSTIWNSNGVVQDGGSSADSPLSTLGVNGQFCVMSDRSSAAGRNLLCFQAATNGAATISLQNYGTATQQALNFVINGTTYAFPGALSQITIGVTPVIGGTNANCLFISAGVVGQQACTLSAITSLTGDITATGPGVSVATLATVNANTGSFGSGAVVPIITVNGKGLITGVSTAPVSVTVGSSVINSGSNQGLLFNNGGVLGNLSTLSSAVLVTSAGGVPSLSTTLPSALSIGSPTFTGTMTMPDSSTWANTGLSKAAALSVGSATLPSGGNVSISGQYQINGTQIAASNLSNGTTGSGAVVLAASPAISGTWTGNATFSGNLTLSGNNTFSGQAIHTGTSVPSSAAGNTVVLGTIAAPTLTNTGQAFLFNTAVNGAVLEGDGSTYDVALLNKSGSVAIGIGTGTTVPVIPGIASGTCSTGLGLDASNNMIKVSCPGASSSIQVGTTNITSGSSGFVLYNNVGVLGNASITGPLQLSAGALSINATTTANGLAIWEGTSAMGNTGAGTLGQHVVSNGAGVDPSFKSGGWTLLNTLTANNSATNLTDTTSISSTYSEYEIVLESIVCATASQSIFIQVNSGGSFQTTGYNSQLILGTGSAVSAQTSSTGILAMNSSSCATSGTGSYTRLYVSWPGGTAPLVFHGTFQQNATSTGGMTGGAYPNTGTFGGVRLITSSGNLASGIMKIYGRL